MRKMGGRPSRLALLVLALGRARRYGKRRRGERPSDDGSNASLDGQKDRAGTFSKQYTWTIQKQVKNSTDSTYGPSATLVLPDGGSGTVDWLITVGRLVRPRELLGRRDDHGHEPRGQRRSAACRSRIRSPARPSVVHRRQDPLDGSRSTGLHGRVLATRPRPSSQIATNTATASWPTATQRASTATSPGRNCPPAQRQPPRVSAGPRLVEQQRPGHGRRQLVDLDGPDGHRVAVVQLQRDVGLRERNADTRRADGRTSRR